MLFLLQDEYEDNTSKDKTAAVANENAAEIKGENKTIKTTAVEPATKVTNDSSILDLLDISSKNNQPESNETDFLLDLFDDKFIEPQQKQSNATTSTSLAFDIFKKIQGSSNAVDSDKAKQQNTKSKNNDKKNSTWFDLFSDLDPLANPTSMEKKISGLNQNSLDA